MIILIAAYVVGGTALYFAGPALKAHAAIKVADAALDAKKGRERAKRARAAASREIRDDEIVFEDDNKPAE